MHTLQSIADYIASKGGQMGVEIPAAIMERAEKESMHGSLLIPDNAIAGVMSDEAVTREFLDFARERNPPRQACSVNQHPNTMLD